VKVQGGLLEVITREIEIECLPQESGALHGRRRRIDDSAKKRASDIPMTESMKLISPADAVIAHSSPSR